MVLLVSHLPFSSLFMTMIDLLIIKGLINSLIDARVITASFKGVVLRAFLEGKGSIA